jgi:hypothetical protein
MEWIAILAIDLAAFRLITMGPSDDSMTLRTQLIAAFLLCIVMPFHAMSVCAKLTGGKDGEQCDSGPEISP